MNKLRLLSIFCLLASGLACATADELVKFPAGPAAWTVDITFTEAAPAEATSPAPGVRPPKSKVRKIEVTAKDNLLRAIFTWTNGKTSERWTVPNLPVVFEGDPRNDSVFPVQSGSWEEKFTQFELAYDFAAFNWITPACQQEKQPVSYQGKQCLHYEGTVMAPAVPVVRGPAGPPSSVKREAWIDSKTLLPVALHTGSALNVFTFAAAAPAAPLELPPKFKKQVDYYKMVMGYP